MRHFDFKNGEMFAEDVALRSIAQDVGTPCYVYSTATFERHYSVFADSFKGIDALVAYSVKANSNVESLPELYVLNATAKELNLQASIAFRVNPDVTAGGHEKISTGKKENKFGIAPFEAAIAKCKDLIARLRAQGHIIQSFDIGGGLGIPYGDNSKTPPPPAEYGALVKRLTSDMTRTPRNASR